MLVAAAVAAASVVGNPAAVDTVQQADRAAEHTVVAAAAVAALHIAAVAGVACIAVVAATAVAAAAVVVVTRSPVAVAALLASRSQWRTGPSERRHCQGHQGSGTHTQRLHPGSSSPFPQRKGRSAWHTWPAAVFYPLQPHQQEQQ